MQKNYRYIPTTKTQLEYELLIKREARRAAQRVAEEKDTYYLYKIKRRQSSGDMNHQGMGGCLTLESAKEIVDSFRKMDDSTTSSYWIEVDTLTFNAKILRAMKKEKAMN